MATKSPHCLIMGKMVSPPYLGFDMILFVLADIEDIIKSRTSSNFGQIGPLTMELAAFEGLF